MVTDGTSPLCNNKNTKGVKNMIKVTDAAAKAFKAFAAKKENPDEFKLRLYIGRAG